MLAFRPRGAMALARVRDSELVRDMSLCFFFFYAVRRPWQRDEPAMQRALIVHSRRASVWALWTSNANATLHKPVQNERSARLDSGKTVENNCRASAIALPALIMRSTRSAPRYTK
mmetsp:Transcript_10152/g.27110  ORF Transcript_10152/g.27110 Transcript_10152/m.27110 type:complete len:116 (+) Transcript_10152:82-429(+)